MVKSKAVIKVGRVDYEKTQALRNISVCDKEGTVSWEATFKLRDKTAKLGLNLK